MLLVEADTAALAVNQTGLYGDFFVTLKIG